MPPNAAAAKSTHAIVLADIGHPPWRPALWLAVLIALCATSAAMTGLVD
jgi:hypothetical protein